MSEVLREETPADHGAIFALHAHAFPSDAEARLVDMLRGGGWLVLGMVAEIDGAVAGHVAFSRLIVQREGEQRRAAGLAPAAVHADFRQRGVAERLIIAAHRKLAAQGEGMSFVLGDPAYYGRFGYDAALASQYRCVYAGPAFQALVLANGPYERGEVIYPPPFAALA